MSNQEEKSNVIPLSSPVPEPIPVQSVPKDKEVRLEDTKIAYIVGMDQEGNFLFQVFGKEPGLLQLMGIHAHATRRVEAIYQDKQITGDRLVHEVGKAVALVNVKMDQVLQVIAPKKPDNQLG